jgi:MHS family proline/betaine transporter-like MFS transporter
VYATYLLISLRIIQGICIGGEFAGNIIYLCETSPPEKRYFFGSIGSCTGSFGILVASVIATIIYATLPEHLIGTIGWRIAFSIAIIFGVISYRMRKNTFETRVFQQVKKSNQVVSFPFKTSIQQNWREYLVVLGILYLHATSFYMIFIFFPTYLKQYLNISQFTSLANNSAMLSLRLLIIPIVGMVSDKIGGLKFIVTASILFLVLSYPLFLMLNSGHTSIMVLGTIILSIMTTLNAGSIPGYLIGLLPPNTRYTLFSFSFNVAYGIFGGIAPIVSIYLINTLSNTLAPVFYLMIAATITLATCIYTNSRKTLYV